MNLIFNYLLLAEVKIKDQFAFGNISSLGEGIDRLVAPVFSLATLLVVIYFLIGAVKLIISGGDKEAINSARAMITHAIIGFVILMFAFLILQFMFSSLFGISDFQIIKFL